MQTAAVPGGVPPLRAALSPRCRHRRPFSALPCSLWCMIERPPRSVHAMLPAEQVPHVDVFIATLSGAAGG